MFTVSVCLIDRADRWVSARKLRGWRSRLLQVIRVTNKEVGLPSDWNSLGHSDATLRSLDLQDRDADLTVLVVPFPLDGNFYMRMLNPHLWVLSLDQILDVLAGQRVPAENFVLRNIYEVWLIRERRLDLENGRWITIPHTAIRGCLLDMSISKINILYSALSLRPFPFREQRQGMFPSVL